MKIKVELLGMFEASNVVGKDTFEVDVAGNTVQDVLNEMVNRYGKKLKDCFYGDKGDFDLNIQISLNRDTFVPVDRLDTSLKDGDTISFILVMAGG